MKKIVRNKQNLIEDSASEQITNITVQELERQHEQICDALDKDMLKDNIITSIKLLRKNLISFSKLSQAVDKGGAESWKATKQKLELKIDLIYKEFFNLQDLINKYEGQEVKITFVHKGKNKEREIRIFDNTADNLFVQNTVSFGGKPYQKLSYKMPQNYQILKNSLPDDQNKTLDEVTQIAEQRYEETRKAAKRRGIIYWKRRGKDWNGYSLVNKGPINEAFVNFYVNTQPGTNYFRGGIEKNIETFVTHSRFGVMQADTLNGFLVGDVSRKGIQYAVKGEFGGPQKYHAVLKLLEGIEDNISHTDLRKILKKFKEITAERARPLIKQTTNEELHTILSELNKI